MIQFKIKRKLDINLAGGMRVDVLSHVSRHMFYNNSSCFLEYIFHDPLHHYILGYTVQYILNVARH